MSTSAMRAVGEAIAGVLMADATLTSMVQENVLVPGDPAIFDDVPENQSYPLVVISLASETPWHTMGGASAGLGWKVLQRIHIYSRAQGETEALRILERIVTLLNFQPLTVAGYSTVIVEYERGRVLLEDIDKIETRHIPAEFAVMVHQ